MADVGTACDACRVIVTDKNVENHTAPCWCREDHPPCQHVASRRRR